MSSRPRYEVLGLGAPIIDYILKVNFAYVKSLSGRVGGIEIVDYPAFVKITQESGARPVPVLGGSANNTIKGLARLGQKCALLGKIGRDEMGDYCNSALSKLGVVPLFKSSTKPTSQVLSLVTPDGQRTIRTFLGASLDMEPEDLDPADFQGVKLVHLEGYSLYNEALTLKTVQLARDAGAKISFDLASFEIARRYKHSILTYLEEWIDVVFANQDEAMALLGLEAEAACHQLASMCEMGVVLLGTKGCLVETRGRQIAAPAYPVDPIDTTGAGDLFVSGFLHGYLNGESIEKCAHYGALTGRAVVQCLGAEIPAGAWMKIKAEM